MYVHASQTAQVGALQEALWAYGFTVRHVVTHLKCFSAETVVTV